MKYEIGSRIRKYRESRGMSQKYLADLIGVSNSRVSNWEQGINRPDADTLAELCRALRVSPSDLLAVHLSENDYTDHEKKVIQAYRQQRDMQAAVDRLLNIGEE